MTSVPPAPGYIRAPGPAHSTHPRLLGTVYTAHLTSTMVRCRRLPVSWSWFNDSKSLGLTEANQADLTAYLETIGAADEPYEAFDAENTPLPGSLSLN